MKKEKIQLMRELKLEKPKKVKVENLVKLGLGLIVVGVGLKALKNG